MRKKIIYTLMSLLVLALIWFLFIKKYDYQINFSIKTSPGTVYSRVNEIKKWPINSKQNNLKVLKSTAFNFIDQSFEINQQKYFLHWEIKAQNDSISRVSIYAIDKKNSLKQRLLYFIGQSSLRKSVLDFANGFANDLQRHTENFRVEIIGKEESPLIKSVIYAKFNSKLSGKAGKMANKIYFLDKYLTDHHIKKEGFPFMNITNWDKQNNNITAEFCFPIEAMSQYPTDSIVKVKQNIKSKPVLKAVYHGNYRYTDRAWFALYNYAKRHNIEIENKILEIYYNDPHNDANELHWKAEVFIPLKN